MTRSTCVSIIMLLQYNYECCTLIALGNVLQPDQWTLVSLTALRRTDLVENTLIFVPYKFFSWNILNKMNKQIVLQIFFGKINSYISFHSFFFLKQQQCRRDQNGYSSYVPRMQLHREVLLRFFFFFLNYGLPWAHLSIMMFFAGKWDSWMH